MYSNCFNSHCYNSLSSSRMSLYIISCTFYFVFLSYYNTRVSETMLKSISDQNNYGLLSDFDRKAMDLTPLLWFRHRIFIYFLQIEVWLLCWKCFLWLDIGYLKIMFLHFFYIVMCFPVIFKWKITKLLFSSLTSTPFMRWIETDCVVWFFVCYWTALVSMFRNVLITQLCQFPYTFLSKTELNFSFFKYSFSVFDVRVKMGL